MQAPAAESAPRQRGGFYCFLGTKINSIYRFFHFQNRLLNGREAAV